MTLPRIARLQCDGFDYSVFATGDFIAQKIFKEGTWEPGVQTTSMLLLRGFTEPAVIDVGANIGLFTVPIANMISPMAGKLYAFEAQRIVFQQLCANIFANRLDCVWAHNKAVGEHAGQIEIPSVDYAKAINIGGLSLDERLQRLRGLEGGIDRSKGETIDIVTLDETKVDGRVRLIKVDVEGMELDVIRGAHRFLEEHRYPPILFEAWEDEAFADERKALDAEITGLGYAISRLGRDNFLGQHPDNEALIELRPEGNDIKLSRVR